MTRRSGRFSTNYFHSKVDPNVCKFANNKSDETPVEDGVEYCTGEILCIWKYKSTCTIIFKCAIPLGFITQWGKRHSCAIITKWHSCFWASGLIQHMRLAGIPGLSERGAKKQGRDAGIWKKETISEMRTTQRPVVDIFVYDVFFEFLMSECTHYHFNTTAIHRFCEFSPVKSFLNFFVLPFCSGLFELGRTIFGRGEVMCTKELPIRITHLLTSENRGFSRTGEKGVFSGCSAMLCWSAQSVSLDRMFK